MSINKQGVNFICKWETGGKNYYENHYKSTFIWPEGASGPTIGVGIDCAYYSKEELNKMFSSYFSPQELSLVYGAVGKKGEAGREYTKKLNGIKLSWDESLEIFEKFTLPKFWELAVKTFPGIENLHDNAKTALCSLVFNRGTDLRGERRKEMRAIRELVPGKNYKSIAAELRKMKRLWKNNSDSDGDLTDRREEEAKLVETA